MTTIDNDSEYQTDTIKRVRDHREDGGFVIELADGGALSVPNPNRHAPPATGDIVRLYGKGIGYPVRGVAIASTTYHYCSPEDQRAKERLELAEMHRERRETFERERPEYLARIERLPAEFQARMRRFPTVVKDWDIEYGSYELFCCEEALKIADAVDDGRAVDRFYKAGIDKQKEMIPTLDYDDHSGNTFGAACHLAMVYLDRPDLVVKAHGALHGLVGCKTYGCWAAYQDDEPGGTLEDQRALAEEG